MCYYSLGPVVSFSGQRNKPRKSGIAEGFLPSAAAAAIVAVAAAAAAVRELLVAAAPKVLAEFA